MRAVCASYARTNKELQVHVSRHLRTTIKGNPLFHYEPVEWVHTPGLTDYANAHSQMQAHAAKIAAGNAADRIWLLEHPPIYTAGTSARDADLLEPDRFQVYRTGRGGQYTYHGPGQRIVYVMLDLNKRQRDVRLFVAELERWIIATLGEFNVKGEIRNDRVGVWVRRPEKGRNVEDKIAAIGIRVRKWVTFHGISLNVEPELEHFSGIVPCGVAHQGVTSLVDLGLTVTMEDVDIALQQTFKQIFGPTTSAHSR